MDIKDSASFFLFEDIENMKEIKDQIAKGSLKAAVVNPVLVFHMDQLLVAAHKSLYNNNCHKMKTKSIFTELLYDLFPSRSIREALKNFGTQDDGTTAIFVVFSGDEEKNSNGLENRVKGKAMPMDRIMELRDVAAIKKLYKIPNEISDEDVILNSILTKMSAKELIL